MNRVYRHATLIFGVVAFVLGIAIVVQTARAGGGVGYVIGALFAALGIGRVYLLSRR